MSRFSSETILPDNNYLKLESEKEDIEKLNALLKAETSTTESDSDEIASNSDDEQAINTEQEIDLNGDIDSLDVNFTLESSYKDQVDSYISKINVINVNKVLLLNKTQQMLLLEGIKKYKELLDECNTQIEAVTFAIKKFVRETKRKPASYYKFGIPFFKTNTRNNCPPNNDVLRKKLNGEIALVDLPPLKFWLSDEKEILRKSVLQQSRKLLLEAGKIDSNTDEECIFPLSNKDAPIDWLQISATDLKGRHTDDECKAMWYLVMHPQLNKSPFGPKEGDRLRKIAEKYNCQNWDKIADELGTNRSGYNCFLYYQLHAQRYKETRKWTPDDDKMLLETVERCRIGSFIPWSTVSYYIKDRSKSQIYTRYSNSLCQSLKKGKFSKEEDLVISALVQKVGTNFSKISSFIPGRTCTQVRIRYQSSLKSVRQSESFRMWTTEEDKKIIEFVKKHGTKRWSQLEKEFKNFSDRSRTSLRHRWAVIKKYVDPETFEGDVSSIRRIKAKIQPKGISRVQVKRMIHKLENLEENNQNPASILTAAKNVSVIDDSDGIIDNFNKYFITKFFHLKFSNEYEEIDIINSLFILLLLDAQININLLTGVRIKHLDEVQRDINNDLKTIINSIQRNPNETIIQFFNTYWETQGTVILNNSNPFHDIIPTIKQFERTLIILRYLLRYVYWKESKLDHFYKRKYGLYCRVIQSFSESPQSQKLVSETEAHIEQISTTRQCKDFYILNVDTERHTPIPLIKETFKIRFLALFTLPMFKSYAAKIIAATINGNNTETFEMEDLTEASQCEAETKQNESEVKKRGRPKKKLPGGRLKYPKDENQEIKNTEKNSSKTGNEPRKKKIKLSNDLQIQRTNPTRHCKVKDASKQS